MISIQTILVSPFMQNARIISDSDTKTCLIIDPGDNCDVILSAISEKQYQISAIILTHSHIDHAGGHHWLYSLIEASGQNKPPLYAGPDPQNMRSSLRNQSQLFGVNIPLLDTIPEPDHILEDNQSQSIGPFSFKSFYTPGHASDHIVLFFEKTHYTYHDNGESTDHDTPFLIAGDTLFAGSIGRTDLPGGDHNTLLTVIREKLFVLPEETLVMPGHGPTTTIGYEKIHNPFFT